MKWIILVVLFAMSVDAAIAKDLKKNDNPSIDPSKARNVLHAYDTIYNPIERGLLEAEIGGMQIGVLWASTMVQVDRKQPPLYCQSGKLMLTKHQMLEMVRNTIKEDPGLGDYPLGMVVLVTLQDNFPCKE
jgi:hypothetical protein